MNRRAIVLTKFPFTDLSATKRRPALVLSSDNPVDPDVIVAFISSVIPVFPNATDLVLDTTHPDFAATGLTKTSVFKMDKLATLDKTIFTGELGEVSSTLYIELKARLRLALDL
jgi:mRNA interferase MazF